MSPIKGTSSQDRSHAVKSMRPRKNPSAEDEATMG